MREFEFASAADGRADHALPRTLDPKQHPVVVMGDGTELND
ncbi:hypothetical protein [Streptomyces sp. Ru72]|nr:hypothetical protein [Streptomyces sp. Ru72]